jgi:hypothetical protein
VVAVGHHLRKIHQLQGFARAFKVLVASDRKIIVKAPGGYGYALEFGGGGRSGIVSTSKKLARRAGYGSGADSLGKVGKEISAFRRTLLDERF